MTGGARMAFVADLEGDLVELLHRRAASPGGEGGPWLCVIIPNPGS
jgi:hypothetical protein